MGKARKPKSGLETQIELLLKKHGPVQRAALCVQDALDGVERNHPRDNVKARIAFVTHLRVIPFARFAGWASIIMTFFETPLWCSQPQVRTIVKDPCNNPMYPSYPIIYLSERSNLILELLCILPICADTMLMLYAQGQAYFKIRRQILRITLLCAWALDMLYAYLTPYWWFRLAPYLRCGLVCLYSHPMRRKLQVIARTLPEVLIIFMLGACFIAFFAWLGVLVFPVNTAEGALAFPNFYSGLWNLLILITTANYPDVMMPGYTHNRASFLFFLVFIMLGVFFLINLATAVVFNMYNKITEEIDEERKGWWEENLSNAFDLLSSVSEVQSIEDGVTVETMRDLFDELNFYQDIPFISDTYAEKLLYELDSDHNGVISWHEFTYLTQVLTMKFKSVSKLPWLERRFPWLSSSKTWKCLKNIILHRCFDITIDIILVFSVLLTIRETWGALEGKLERHFNKREAAFNSWELYINFIFVSEVFLKILVLGFETYWKSVKNKFDFMCTAFTATVTLYVYLPNDINDPVVIRYAAILRLGRLLRLLIHVKRFHVIAETFIRMLPDADAVLKVLFCAMYTFTVLGTQLFGGVINTDPHSHYSKPLAATDFAQAGYYANNFNDMPSGIVVLFELLVVNNWFEIVDGFTSTCGPWAYLFFIVWYVFGVLIFLNVVVAFILDSFVNAYSDNLKKAAEKEAAKKKNTEHKKKHFDNNYSVNNLIDPDSLPDPSDGLTLPVGDVYDAYEPLD